MLPPAATWPKAGDDSTALHPAVGTRRRLSMDFMKPSPNRVGMRSTASSDVATETSPMRANVSAPTSAPPPAARGAYIPARARAVATPPPPPSSAARKARLLWFVRACIMFFMAVAVHARRLRADGPGEARVVTRLG